MAQPILIEPNTRFTCDPCGFCCGPWDISVDRKTRQSLLEKEWVATKARKAQESVGQDLFKVIGQGELSVIQRANGMCSFLNEQLLCSIHIADGLEAKPQVCQQYPNIYYGTPRGIEVYLDHSCPEVIRNAGELVTAEAIQQTLPREHVQEVGSRFPLDSSTSIDWHGYLELEGTFLEILRTPISFEDQILKLNQLLRELSKGLNGANMAGSVAVRSVLDSLSSEADSQSARAKASAANTSKRDLYVAILVHWVESSYSSEVSGKSAGAATVILNVLRQWKGIGEEEFTVFGLRVNYRNANAVVFDRRPEEFSDAVSRYLNYLVRALVATEAVTLQKRLAIIATNFALFKWLSKAHASSNGRSDVGLDDVVFGIKMVEKFLSNRLFNRLGGQKTFISKFVALLFENPSLPSTMLG